MLTIVTYCLLLTTEGNFNLIPKRTVRENELSKNKKVKQLAKVSRLA